ncbi:MAG: TetR/AcrR family transcriptional regulator [Chloroflexota bacterium]
MRLIRSQGFNATGISQILAESGVPKGSLYHHFPMGKIELTVSAIRLANKSILSHLNQLNDASSSAVEVVKLYFDYYVSELEQGDYENGCPIATVTLEAAAQVQSIQIECEATFDQMQEFAESLLIHDGIPEHKAPSIALNIIAGLQGALLMSKAKRSTQPLATMRDNLIQQIQETIPLN